MKKIFAFAIALVAMATSMVSCNNDNTDFIEQKAPTPTPVSVSTTTTTVEESEASPEFDGKIYFGVTADQFEYTNTIYNVTVNGETVEVNVANLPVATDVPFKNQMRESLKETNPIFYVYQVPATTKGSIKVIPNISIKEGVDVPVKMNFIRGAAANGHCYMAAFHRLQDETSETMLSRVNTATAISFAIK